MASSGYLPDEDLLVCSVPRVSCPEHGVITIATPWANPQSRTTRMFERLAIDMLKPFKNQTKVAKLLRISFDQVHHIMQQAVQRGLARRSQQASLRPIGIDEKSFQKGHRYSTIISDLDTGCVIDLCEHRDEKSVTELIHKNFTEEQKDSLEVVSLDMWKPFINAVKTCFPKLDIVHDRFHLAKYLNQAVDQTRRKEAKRLAKQGQNHLLKRTRYIFLTNPENWSEAYKQRFEQIKAVNLKTAEAWQIKENFKPFFQLRSIEQGNMYFHEWFEDAMKTNITAIKKSHHHVQKTHPGYPQLYQIPNHQCSTRVHKLHHLTNQNDRQRIQIFRKIQNRSSIPPRKTKPVPIKIPVVP